MVGVKQVDVRIVAEDLLERIKNYSWSMLSPELYISISIGIATITHNERIQELLLRAVHGSVLAKRLGGNKVASEANIPIRKVKKGGSADDKAYITAIAYKMS